jgi:hypothetical protein
MATNDALAPDQAELNAADASGAFPTSVGFEPEKLGMLMLGASGSVTDTAPGADPTNALGWAGIGKLVLIVGATFENDGALPGLFGSVTDTLMLGALGAFGNAIDTGSMDGLVGIAGIDGKLTRSMFGGFGTSTIDGSLGKSFMVIGFGRSLPASAISVVAFEIAVAASDLSEFARAFA